MNTGKLDERAKEVRRNALAIINRTTLEKLKAKKRKHPLQNVIDVLRQ